uniref:Uncharacterized protein n=1 Tax=Glossina pallidipes TaxID=7398 RepID=A0A1B0A2X2_GLOPL
MSAVSWALVIVDIIILSHLTPNSRKRLPVYFACTHPLRNLLYRNYVGMKNNKKKSEHPNREYFCEQNANFLKNTWGQPSEIEFSAQLMDFNWQRTFIYENYLFLDNDDFLQNI